MNVLIGLVTWRAVEVECTLSLIRLVTSALQTQGISVSFGVEMNDPVLARARSRMASKFLASGADVLLSIDSDMVFEPQAAMRLVRQAPLRGLVGAAYPVRDRIHKRLAAKLRPGQRVVIGEGPPQAVDVIGAGLMAISRGLLDTLATDTPLVEDDEGPPWYAFYMQLITPGERGTMKYGGDDAALCWRALRAGIEPMLDPQAIALQIGPDSYALPPGTICECTDDGASVDMAIPQGRVATWPV